MVLCGVLLPAYYVNAVLRAKSVPLLSKKVARSVVNRKIIRTFAPLNILILD